VKVRNEIEKGAERERERERERSYDGSEMVVVSVKIVGWWKGKCRRKERICERIL
jgi:hypothetical protein